MGLGAVEADRSAVRAGRSAVRAGRRVVAWADCSTVRVDRSAVAWASHGPAGRPRAGPNDAKGASDDDGANPRREPRGAARHGSRDAGRRSRPRDQPELLSSRRGRRLRTGPRLRPARACETWVLLLSPPRRFLGRWRLCTKPRLNGGRGPRSGEVEAGGRIAAERRERPAAILTSMRSRKKPKPAPMREPASGLLGEVFRSPCRRRRDPVQAQPSSWAAPPPWLRS